MAYKTEMQIDFGGIIGVQNCVVEYTAFPASGNGWDEPREEAYVEVDGIWVIVRDRQIDVADLIEDWDELEAQVESELGDSGDYEPDYDDYDDRGYDIND